MKQNKTTAAKRRTGPVHTHTINLAVDSKERREMLKKDPGSVMAGLVKQQRTQYSKTVGDLIAARHAAGSIDYPQRARLYDFYEDMLNDEMIYGQIYNHRILPVKNRNFKISNAAGVKDEKKAKLFNVRWIPEYIEYCLLSKFWGFSLIYLNELEAKDGVTWIKKIELFDRYHVLQEKGFIVNWQSDFTGTNYLEQPVSNYCMPIGNVRDLGLLNKAAHLWLLKKHAWQNWDEFAELFGIPIRIVKTNSDDPRVIAEIEGWTKDMGTAAYGIFPEGTEIDIKENSKTDAYKVFYEMIKSANEGLAILFSGQTMTSMDGSSKSQAEVHADVATEIRKDDEKFITFEINNLINLLRIKFGYPFDEGDVFEWDVAEDETALIAKFKAVDEMGFQLDPDEVSNRLGVKILGIKSAAVPVDEKEDPKEKEPAPDLKKEEQDIELSMNGILKLHAGIAMLYGGKHVH